MAGWVVDGADVTLTSPDVTANEDYGISVRNNGTLKVTTGDFETQPPPIMGRPISLRLMGPPITQGPALPSSVTAKAVETTVMEMMIRRMTHLNASWVEPQVLITIGTGNNYGQRFTADRNSTLESFEVYVSTSSGTCTNDYYFMERVSSTSYKVLCGES